MKKSFEYDLTKYDPNAPTKTEEFLTADGVKTLTTDANNGAVLIQDTVDEDSLNPVTAAAVATAIEQGGGGSSYEAGDGISIADGEISAKVDGSTISINADGELEAIGGGGGGGVPTPTSSSVLLGTTRNQSSQWEPEWKSSAAVGSIINGLGANTWQAQSYDADGTIEWTVSIASNVITLTPDALIVPNRRASHLYLQFPVKLQQLSSGWTGGLIHADVDFKYKCTGLDPDVAGEYAYDRHRVVRVTQYEPTRWAELQIAAELLVTDQYLGTGTQWYLFDTSKNCGISEVTITITDDSGTALPVNTYVTENIPVLAWLD